MKRDMSSTAKPRIRVRPRGQGQTRIEAVLQGKTVSWLTVIHLKLRIGTAQVSMGGIGGVGTESAFRRKGYSRMCLDQSIETMRELGLETSVLFGIADFYPKWGFASAIAEPVLTISTRAAEESRPTPGQRIEKFDPERHTPALLELYAANNRERSASLVRPGPIIRDGLRHWVPFQKGSSWEMPVEAFVVLDQEGSVRGYAAHDDRPEAVVVVEAGYADPDVFPTIVAELASRAVQKRAGQITFHVPIDHPLAAYLHRHNSLHQVRYNKNSNGMARIIKLYETLRACAPDLARRMKNGPSLTRHFPLGIKTDIGSVTLQSVKGNIRARPGLSARTVLEISQAALTQLLLGYRGLEDLAGAQEVRLPAPMLKILNPLFPAGFPYMWEADRF